MLTHFLTQTHYSEFKPLGPQIALRVPAPPPPPTPACPAAWKPLLTHRFTCSGVTAPSSSSGRGEEALQQLSPL